MPKAWISKIAPLLKVSLAALKGVMNAYGLPFPIPRLSFLDQYSMMQEFVDSLLESGFNALVSHCENVLENGVILH
jgi:hypothetical protein